MAAEWGYNKNNGPSEWVRWYPISNNGTRQSPVDIIPSTCTQDKTLPALKFQYISTWIKLINTGSSWRMDFQPEGSNLSGGPLDSDYKVLQMHAHWGAKSGCGSEHTLDGKMFDAELHIVHYNSKYGDPAIAIDKPDGLAVLGMFVKTGRSHPEFEKLCDNLNEIPYRNDSLQLQEKLNPMNCLPKDKSFFTYPGSLTTPPLFESVTWLVFREPIEMSSAQLNRMRALKVGETEICDFMVNNYRPPCPLGTRTVRIKS